MPYIHPAEGFSTYDSGIRNLEQRLDILLTGAEQLGLRLNTRQIELFHLYESALLSWNQHINLSGIKNPNQIQSKHFLESIAAYNMIITTLPNVSSMLDLGSGAGFPGIPLKLILEDVALCLVESIKKESQFPKESNLYSRSRRCHNFGRAFRNNSKRH